MPTKNQINTSRNRRPDLLRSAMSASGSRVIADVSPQEFTMNKNESGTIDLCGETILYESDVYPNWQLNLNDVVCIGEYTDENGPFADDYFISFVTNETGCWYDASVYALGRDPFLRDLSGKLGHPIILGLFGSTTFHSRILYPFGLVGQEMFRFQNERVSASSGAVNQQCLADIVLKLQDRANKSDQRTI